MARKFALYLKDGHEVRNNIEEIKEYFDYGKVVEYFYDGRLMQWLEDRRYEKESIALSDLDDKAPDFKEKLCYIFSVDSKVIEDDKVAIEDAEIIRKRDLVKQYTNDENILSNMDSIAFSQEELQKMQANKKSLIYLCGNNFSISAKYENIKYIGLGKVTITIDCEIKVDFEQKNIRFENVNIDASYLNVPEKTDMNDGEKVKRNFSIKDNLESVRKGRANTEVVYEILSNISTVDGWVQDRTVVEKCIEDARLSSNTEEIVLVDDYRNNLIVTDRAVYSNNNIFFRKDIPYSLIWWADYNGNICLNNYQKSKINTEKYYHGIINEEMGLFLNVMAKLFSKSNFLFSKSERKQLDNIFLKTTDCTAWELIQYRENNIEKKKR